MNTSRRSTRLILAVAGAVAIVATAVLVVPGLAGARDGGAASGVPEPAPAAMEPAVGSVSMEPAAGSVSMQPAAGPGPVQPVAPTGQTEPAPSIEPDPGPRSARTGPPPPSPVTPSPSAPAVPRADNLDAAVSSPVLPYDPGYWTPERMANAKPMPMPTVP